jgi:uncharacterized protein
MANLEVDRVAISTDGQQFAEVQMLILGNKAFESAEEYVLGLFHLYFTVYFHKTTRSAEKMLGALIARIGQLVKDGNVGATGLTPGSPLNSVFEGTEPAHLFGSRRFHHPGGTP